MDKEAFRAYLRRGGRSPSAVERCLRCTAEFQDYLDSQRGGIDLDQAGEHEMEGFVTWLESQPKSSAKTHLWALRYYYQFTGNEAMSRLAAGLRRERIRPAPPALSGFLGVNPDYVRQLNQEGISNAGQMLEVGRSPSDRAALAERAGLPLGSVEELVKLSDLARIPGIAGVRARLYHDAGVDSVAKLARWEPDELEAMLVDFVQRSGFDGMAPTPKEVAFSVARARGLDSVIEL